MGELPGWLILLAAVLVGYFAIGKAIEFFKRGSAWDDARAVDPQPRSVGPAVDDGRGQTAATAPQPPPTQGR